MKLVHRVPLGHQSYPEWIYAAERIVRTEFERSYANRGGDTNGGESAAEDNANNVRLNDFYCLLRPLVMVFL
jgi:hypothetical protein